VHSHQNCKGAEIGFVRETRRSNLRRIPQAKSECVRRTWIPTTSLVASCSDLVASNCLAMTARTSKNKANPLNLKLCVSPLLRFLTPAVNTRNGVLIPTGVRSQNHSIRPVAFGEALPAGTRLTLFSDDKPDRFFTVIKCWMDGT
jgi:hypothetical protein